MFRCTLVIALALAAVKLHAATLYWDGTTATGNTWDTSTPQWHLDAPDALPLVVWDNAANNTAVFALNPAAITLASEISAAAIQVEADGFSLQGAKLALGGGIGVASNASLLIASEIAGSNGLAKTGAGTLVLGRHNTYSGDTNVQSGVLRLAAPGAVQDAHFIPPGAVAHYAFDNAGNLGQDSSPNNNQLTNVGAPVYTASGKFGGALQLNGSSALLQLAAFPTGIPTGSSAYSISVWINPNPAGGRWGMIGWGSWGIQNQVNAFRMENPTTLINYWWANDLIATTPAPLSSAWHHVLVTYDPTLAQNQHTLYLDGAMLLQRTAAGMNSQAVNFAIGRTFNTEYFQGLLDDVVIYDRALTLSDIETLYTGGTGNVIPDNSNVAVANGAAFDVNGNNETVGALSGSGNVTLGAGMLSIGGGDAGGDFGGVISGTGKLVKTGTGTTTLSNQNLCTGGTQIESGTLKLGHVAALPIGPGNGTITVNGKLDLNGYSPDFSALAGNGIVTNSAVTPVVLTLGAFDTGGVFSCPLQDGTGTASLRKIGSGVLIVAGANTYSGETRVDAGTLRVGAGIPTGPAAFYTFDDSNDLGKDSSSNANHLTASGAPAASAGVVGGGMQLNGSSMLVPPGAFPARIPVGGSSYTVAAWINPDANPGPWGIVGWGSYGVTNQVNAFRTLSDTQLVNYWWANDLNSAVVPSLSAGAPPSGWHHALAVYDSGTSTHSIYIDGMQRGTRNATGLNVSAADFTLGRTYPGQNEFFRGYLDDVVIYDRALDANEIQTLFLRGQAGALNVLPDATAVIVKSGAALEVHHDETIGSISGETGCSLLLGSGSLKTGGSNATTAFDGIISGSGGFEKTGSGVFTLSQANTCSGPSAVSGGTLLLTGSVASPITVSNGGTLAGNGTLGKLTVESGGLIEPGIGVGTLSTGGLALSPNAILKFDLGANSDLIAVTGDVALGGSVQFTAGAGFGVGAYTLITYTGSKSGSDPAVVNSSQFEPSIDSTIAGMVTLLFSSITVISIRCAEHNPSNQPNVTFNVKFGTKVTGVDASDFVLTTSGVQQASIESITATDAQNYVVTVATGTDDGTIRLDLIDDNSIESLAGAKLGGPDLNDGDFNSGETYTIDKTPSTVTTNQSVGQDDPTQATPVLFTVVFSEPAAAFVAGDLTFTGSATPATVVITDQGDARTFSVALSDFDTDGVVQASIAANAVQDLAGNGNLASTSTDNTVAFDIAGTPTVVRVTSADADGFYSAGNTIRIRVLFSKRVFVDGFPELALQSGASAKAVYSSGSESKELEFSYTVSPGDASARLDYASTSALTLPGGATIRDVFNVDANLTLGAPGSPNSLSGASNITVDTQAPGVTNVTAANDDGTYGTGAEIQIQVQFNEIVLVTSTPSLTLKVGTADKPSTYTSGSGSDTLVFTYTVAAGDSAAELTYASGAAVQLNGGTIADRADNVALLSLPAPGATGSLEVNKSIAIDAISPRVLNVSSATPSGTYGSGAQIVVNLTWDKAVDVVGAPTIQMQTGRSGAAAVFSNGSGTSTLSFNYIPAAGDSTPDLDYSSTSALILDGTTIADLLGNSADTTLPAPGAAGSLATNADIALNTKPTITSITPAFGVAAGGTTVTITGTSLDSSSVSFGGSAGLVLTQTPSQVLVTTPAHTQGVVNVTVTGPGGTTTQADAFTYYGPPIIVTISPDFGPLTGGQSVTLTGSNFVPGTVVSFGGTNATNVVVVNATTITATTPAHLGGSVEVKVQTPFAQTYSILDGYTYNSPPVFVSDPVANPASPFAQRPVTITVVTADADGDTVQVSFDWGDGASGASNQHAYSNAGQYTVTITLDDGLNMTTHQLTLTVVVPEAFTVAKLGAAFSFKKSGADSCQITGTIPNVPAGYVFAGKTLSIDVGGAAITFALDAKGKGKTAAGSVALKLKFKKGTAGSGFVGGPVTFSAKFKGALAPNWVDEGISPSQNYSKAPIDMTTDLVFGDRSLRSTDRVLVTSKANSGGKFAK